MRSWAPWFANRVQDRREAPRQPMGFDTQRGKEANDTHDSMGRG